MNNRYRNAPGLRGPTKASASTLCQKCLKRGHYSYECTASAQERPYLARPSRTQQLQNPKLRPKLSSDTPNDLLRTEGLADKLLAKREEERGRKRDNDVLDPVERRGQSPRRSRSESAHSMSSVSTISTSRSQSRSPPRHGGDDQTGSRHSKTRKRHYSDSSSGRSVSLIRLARGLVRDPASGHATETRGGGDGNPARLSVDGLQICPEMVTRNTDLGAEIVIRSQGAGVL